uniref:Defensin beta 14 n=1 Tax=Jaculus jaculus TaxID=51337 RepID=A0A8C5JWN7_JACJA|nr:beta-defensin 103A-like [Jaculus jaculus]
MRIHYLLFALLFLFLVPVPGDGFLFNSLRKFYCKVRGGRCAVLSCLPREKQIGSCSSKGRKCCQRKK